VSKHKQGGEYDQVVYEEFVSDIDCRPATLAEAVVCGPRTEYERRRDRIVEEWRHRKRIAALHREPDFQGKVGLKAYCSLKVDWDEVIAQSVKLTDGQAVTLWIFLSPRPDGTLEVNPLSGWPVAWSYCQTGVRLHELDPVQHQSCNGGPVAQQTVKDKVVPAFSKMLYAYLQRVMPNMWPLKLVREVVREHYGDESHCVPHTHRE